jgi:hypothetical protein
VWTSKCDFWPSLEPEGFDADELNAPTDCSAYAAGCYIDILPKIDRAWSLPNLAETACRHLCSLLCPVPLRGCRVDLIVRSALIVSGEADMGITAYITACGATLAGAAQTLEAALAAFAHALCPVSTLQ